MKAKLKIIGLFLLVSLGAGLLIIVLTHFQMAGLILQGARGQLNLGAQIASTKIVNILEGREDNLRYLANLLLTRNYVQNYQEYKKTQLARKPDEKKIAELKNRLARSRAELERFLTDYLAGRPFVSDLRLINLEGWEILHLKNGQVINDFWDISRTDLYKKVAPLNVGGFYRSEVELENTPSGRDYHVTAGLPVVVDDARAAFLAARLDFWPLGKYLGKNLVSSQALVWLVDENGLLLIHPDRSWLGQKISEMNVGEVKQFIKGLLINESGQGTVNIAGDKYFINFRPLNFKNWKILVLIPEKGLLGGLKNLRLEQAAIIFGAFLALLIFIFKLVEKEYRSPMKKLVETIRTASDAESFNQVRESNGDIREIFKSLDQLFKKFKNSHLQLSEKDQTEKEQTARRQVKKIEEKYARVMKLATTFLELAPEHNLKKTLERVLDDLKNKLKIKTVAVVLNDLTRNEQIIQLVRGLEDSQIKSLEELAAISTVVEFQVTSKIGGELYLLKQDLALDETEREFLNRLSLKVGRVIREALHQEEKTVVDTLLLENRQAKNLKEKFFQLNFPRIKNFDFATVYLPAAGAGGSFFSFIGFLDEGYLDLAFGEIPGSGLKVAVEVGVLKGLMKSRALVASGPAEIVADVNRVVFEEYPEMTPTGLSYNMIDVNNKTISTVNVGEVLIAYFRQSGKKLSSLKADLLGLGSQREIKVTSRKIILTPGDILIYLNKQFIKIYGLDRLQEFLSRKAFLPLGEMAAALKEDCLILTGDKLISQDVLALFVRIN